MDTIKKVLSSGSKKSPLSSKRTKAQMEKELEDLKEKQSAIAKMAQNTFDENMEELLTPSERTEKYGLPKTRKGIRESIEKDLDMINQKVRTNISDDEFDKLMDDFDNKYSEAMLKRINYDRPVAVRMEMINDERTYYKEKGYSVVGGPPVEEEVKTLSVDAAVSSIKKMEKDAIEQEIAVEAATADTVQQATPIEQLQEEMTLATVGTANPIIETSSMSAEAVNIQLNQDVTQVAEPVTTNIDASQVAINTDQGAVTDPNAPMDPNAPVVPGSDQVPNASSDATISGQGTGFTGQGAVYHRTAIAIFFNNADTPDWDTQLNSNIESSGASAEEMSKMMSDIIASEGPLILVSSVKSATMQEFKEIMQLHFSLHRQMSRGSRVPTIGVPLGSLLNFRNQVSGSGDASLKPYIPVSSQGSQATPIVKPDLAKAWDNRAHWQSGPSKPSMYYALQEQVKPIIYDERGSGGPTKELRGLMILPTGREECE